MLNQRLEPRLRLRQLLLRPPPFARLASIDDDTVDVLVRPLIRDESVEPVPASGLVGETELDGLRFCARLRNRLGE